MRTPKRGSGLALVACGVAFVKPRRNALRKGGGELR
jgi:hypothetical protein